MSSNNKTSESIATFVPILNRTNFPEWKAQMTTYLHSQGLWQIINETFTHPATNNNGEQDKWDVSDNIAQGKIELQLDQTICSKVGANSAVTWTALETAFRTMGISHIYRDFKSQGTHCWMCQLPNPFTLAVAAIQVEPRPVIALQPSQAPPNTSTIVGFKPSAYSTIMAKEGSAYTGAPAGPSPNTLQQRWAKLKQLDVTPTTQALKVWKTLIQRMGLPNHSYQGMWKGKKPLAPSIVEISDDSDDGLMVNACQYLWGAVH